MLALFGNVALPELMVVAFLAVIVFGRRLPEVAGKAYVNLRRMRGKFEDLRRESGIDVELRRIERTMHEARRIESLPGGSGHPGDPESPPLQPRGRPRIVPPPGGPVFPERPNVTGPGPPREGGDSESGARAPEAPETSRSTEDASGTAADAGGQEEPRSGEGREPRSDEGREPGSGEGREPGSDALREPRSD